MEVNIQIECRPKGVEDKYLGEQLYVEIMQEFLRRMASRRGEAA